MSAPRVVIAGGGIAGMCTAYFLRRGGAEVTVLESNRLGSAASSWNAGWVCPAQAGPLPEPGLAAEGLRSLMTRDSALYFAPTQLPSMAGWLARFAWHCNTRAHRRGIEALARFGRRSFELIELLQADGVEFDVHRRGLLVAAEQRAHAAAFLERVQPMRALGYTIPDRLLDGTEMRELEPALADVVEAGIKIDEHWHVHSPSFMRALAAKLAAMGVGLEEGAHVVDLAAEGGRVREVLTTAGAYPADSVVLAAGAWTPEIARMLGVRLPVRPGKGYAFEVDVAEPPRHALMLAEPHVGCSPLGDRIRIAGTMEFSGLNARIDHRRVAGIVRGATRMLRVLDEPRLQNVRSGMRPIAPDGLPIVDRLPRHDNVYVATAYSMLGITLGAPAGEALARLILEGERPPELEPFRASRFAGLGIRGRADARSSAR